MSSHTMTLWLINERNRRTKKIDPKVTNVVSARFNIEVELTFIPEGGVRFVFPTWSVTKQFPPYTLFGEFNHGSIAVDEKDVMIRVEATVNGREVGVDVHLLREDVVLPPEPQLVLI